MELKEFTNCRLEQTFSDVHEKLVIKKKTNNVVKLLENK